MIQHEAQRQGALGHNGIEAHPAILVADDLRLTGLAPIRKAIEVEVLFVELDSLWRSFSDDRAKRTGECDDSGRLAVVPKNNEDSPRSLLTPEHRRSRPREERRETRQRAFPIPHAVNGLKVCFAWRIANAVSRATVRCMRPGGHGTLAVSASLRMQGGPRQVDQPPGKDGSGAVRAPGGSPHSGHLRPRAPSPVFDPPLHPAEDAGVVAPEMVELRS